MAQRETVRKRKSREDKAVGSCISMTVFYCDISILRNSRGNGNAARETDINRDD